MEFDISTAVRVFLAQSLKMNGLPSDVRLSNGKVETLSTVDEIENQIRNKDGQIFKNANKFFENLKSWVLLGIFAFSRFKKDFKTLEKRGYDVNLLKDIVSRITPDR